MTPLRSNGNREAASAASPSPSRPAKDVFWLMLSGLAFLALQIPLASYVVDDTFIHLTFARNIAAGDGFAFNPGEPTYGVTAPFWTLLLALFSLILEPSGTIAKLLSILFGLLTIPLFRELADRLGLSAVSARWATFAWAVNVWLARWSASGMETSCALLFLMIAILSQFEGRVWRCGIFAGFAYLCRPESAGLALVLIADRWWSDGGKAAAKSAAGWLLPVLPWTLYAFAAFGTIVSNPAKIKSDAGLPALGDFLLGLKRTSSILGGSHGVEILIILAGTILLWKYRPFADEKGRRAALLAVWALFPALIYLSRGVFVSSRYLMIGLPPLLLGTFLTLETLPEYRWRREIPRLIPLLGAALVVLQLALTAFVTAPHIASFRPTLQALSRMAAVIRERTEPEAVIAVGDVGLVGFYAERKILDIEGLVSAEIIPYRIGMSLDDFITTGRFLKGGRADYILDKARDPRRLEGGRLRAELIEVIPVPGALVDSSEEDWYYTLYRLGVRSANQ